MAISTFSNFLLKFFYIFLLIKFVVKKWLYRGIATQKALADCGAAFLSVWTMGDSCLLSLLHGARLLATTSWIRNKKKEKGRKMAEVSFALLCPSRTAESHSQIVISTLLFWNLIARGAGSLRPSTGCTCFGLDQFLASASWVSHFSEFGVGPIYFGR